MSDDVKEYWALDAQMCRLREVAAAAATYQEADKAYEMLTDADVRAVAVFERLSMEDRVRVNDELWRRARREKARL